MSLFEALETVSGGGNSPPIPRNFGQAACPRSTVCQGLLWSSMTSFPTP